MSGFTLKMGGTVTVTPPVVAEIPPEAPPETPAEIPIPEPE